MHTKACIHKLEKMDNSFKIFLKKDDLLSLFADDWSSGKGVRLSILDVVLDTSSIPSSANKFNVSG